jgi:CsoR family transcriptional regulator, copper-sensing transcriptional repressor
VKTDKKDALNRLAYIEGHIRGIKKMVEEDQYCVDIIKQTRAVKRALDRFDALLLRNHLATCVPEGIREGRDEQIIGELNDLFELSRR